MCAGKRPFPTRAFGPCGPCGKARSLRDDRRVTRYLKICQGADGCGIQVELRRDSAGRTHRRSALRSVGSTRKYILLVAIASPALCLFPSSPALGEPPPTVTIEAQRNPEHLRREVDQFVAATIVKPHGDESLLRWDSPVCPLVAGLTREQGEFVLGRLSQIARAAKAPLAGQTCTANLYVIVAHNPSGFLRLWWRHDRRLFNTNHGIAAVKRFIETDRPVRVWYNYMLADPDAGSGIATMLPQSVGIGVGAGPTEYPINRNPSFVGSRLTYTAVRAIASAIVVIDAQKVAKLNFVQLADYVSLRSLAEINPDRDVGEAPTILRLFSKQQGSPPQGLTAWDQALLRAVYTSTQKDRMQLSEIETATLDAIVAGPLH